MSIPSLSCTASIVLPGIGHLMISFHLSFPSYQTSSLQHCYGFPGLLSNGSCFGRCRFLCNTVVGNRKGWKSRTLPENGLFAALKFYDVEKKKNSFHHFVSPKDVNVLSQMNQRCLFLLVCWPNIPQAAETHRTHGRRLRTNHPHHIPVRCPLALKPFQLLSSVPGGRAEFRACSCHGPGSSQPRVPSHVHWPDPAQIPAL